MVVNETSQVSGRQTPVVVRVGFSRPDVGGRGTRPQISSVISFILRPSNITL